MDKSVIKIYFQFLKLLKQNELKRGLNLICIKFQNIFKGKGPD